MMKYSFPPHNGQAVNEQEKTDLLTTARKYLGTRFLHRGRSCLGLDCVGLLIVTIQDVLGTWVEVADYPEWPNPQVMRDMCNLILIPLKREAINPGDVALLYAPGLGVVHLGWYTGKTLIHANNEAHAGKVVETTLHPDWNLRGAYAVPRYEAA